MNKDFFLWAALTTLAAVMLASVFFQATFGWSVCGGILAISLLGLRDRIEVRSGLDAREIALQETAEQLGFNFEGGCSQQFNVLGWSDSFRLTESAFKSADTLGKAGFGGILLGMCFKSSNVMQRQKEGSTLAVYDFCQPSCVQPDTSIRQTVLALKSPKLEFSYFAIVPAHSTDRLKARFGTNVEIIEGYCCYGDPPPGLQNELRSCSEILGASYVLEAGDGYLLLYRDERTNRGQTLLQPYEIDAFVQQAFILYNEVLGRTLSSLVS